MITRNPLIKDDIIEDIEKMKQINCDTKIISLHRGAEYRHTPNQANRNLAYEIIDAGADLILGGHSHIPGEYEQYNGKYIFYSF